MKKINIIGTSGSGKSTFSKRLAEQLNYPYIQMDQVYWLPNWQEPDREEYFPKVEAAIDRPTWVLDGNYKRTTFIKWKNVDTVIWLDYPFWLTLYRISRRAIQRIWSKQELWPGTGNRETLAKLFSKDSIILWMITSYHRNKRHYQAVMQDPQWAHIHFLRFTHPKQAQQFLDDLVTKTHIP